MGFRWVTAADELRVVRAELEQLRHDREQLRAEWRNYQVLLEELQRRNLNTIRSLRRISRIAQDEPDEPAEPSTQGSLELASYDELQSARRHYGG